MYLHIQIEVVLKILIFNWRKEEEWELVKKQRVHYAWIKYIYVYQHENYILNMFIYIFPFFLSFQKAVLRVCISQV